MKAAVTKIESIAKNDFEKIWRIVKGTALSQNLKDTPEMNLTKKLVSNRMAEAEATRLAPLCRQRQGRQGSVG